MPAPFNIYGTYAPENRTITEEVVDLVDTGGSIYKGFLRHFPVVAASYTVKTYDLSYTYIESTDYTMDKPSGTITWIVGTVPSRVKVTYTYEFQFYYGSYEYYGQVIAFARPLPPQNFYAVREANYYVLKWNAPDFNEDGTKCTPTSYYVYRSGHSNKRDPELIAVLTTSDPLIPPDTCYVDTLDEDRIGDTVYYYQIICVNDRLVGGIATEWTTDLFIVRDAIYNDTGLYDSSKNNYFYQLLKDIPPSVVFDKEANIIPFRSVWKWNETTEKYDIPFSDYLIFDFFPNLAEGNTLSVKIDDVSVGTNELIQFPCNFTDAITAVNTGTQTFTIAGSHINTFKSPKIVVEDSTGNNGTYTIDTVQLHQTAITNELFNAYDLQLDHYPVISGSEVLTNIPATITYVKGIDYNIDYSTGKLTWLAGAIPLEAYASYSYSDSTKTDITVTQAVSSSVADGVIRAYGEPFFYLAVQSLPYKDEFKIDICNADGSVIYKTKTYKPYTYLMFFAAMSVALMQSRLDIEKTQNDLYKDECEFDKLYPNFGSFFNFPKPKYLTDEQYKDLLIGNDVLPGLYNAGFKGGTWGALKDAIESLTNVEPTIETYKSVEGWTVRNQQLNNVLDFEIVVPVTPGAAERHIVDYITNSIVAIDTVNKYIYVHGDISAIVVPTDVITVFGSTGNDRDYTVTAVLASTPTITDELVNITSNAGQLLHFPVVAASYTIKNTAGTITYVEGVGADYELDATLGKITWHGLTNPPTPTQVEVTYNYDMTRLTVTETIPETIPDGSVFHSRGLWNGYRDQIAEWNSGTVSWDFTVPFTTAAVINEVVTISSLKGNVIHLPIQAASETITGMTGTPTYVRGTHYRIDYLSGLITWISGVTPSSVKVSYTYIISDASVYVEDRDKVYIFDGYFWKDGFNKRHVLKKANQIIPIVTGKGYLWFIPYTGVGTYSITSPDETITYSISTDYTLSGNEITWVSSPVPSEVKIKYFFTLGTGSEWSLFFSTLYKTFTWKMIVNNEIRVVVQEPVVSSAYIDYLDGYPILYILSGGIITDEYGQSYSQGSDFTVDDATGKIIWKNQPGTQTPPVGRKYYVDYVFSLRALVDYMVELLKFPQYEIYHVSGVGFGLVAFGVFPFGSP